MKQKLVTADQALALVRDGDTVAFSGFVGTGTPEALMRTKLGEGLARRGLSPHVFETRAEAQAYAAAHRAKGA
jgi:acyl CoA:acetate/3-ketoacid CoA transferase